MRLDALVAAAIAARPTIERWTEQKATGVNHKSYLRKTAKILYKVLAEEAKTNLTKTTQLQTNQKK